MSHAIRVFAGSLPVSLAFVLLASGCAAPVDETDTLESPLSSVQARVLPTDEGSRASCRAVAEMVYCSESDARAAAAQCAGGSRGGSVAVRTSVGPCASAGAAYPTPASCDEPRELDCSFYSACVERSIPCGPSGYALGFGEKYCTAFRAANLSAAGKKWVGRTMACLQRALVPEIREAGEFTTRPASAERCAEVLDTAFASHPDCYTAKESSICFLPPGDIVTVLDTIGLREILTRRTSSQMLTTAGICIGQLTQRLFGFSEKRAVAAGRSATIEDEVVAPRDELEASLAEWRKLEAEAR